MNILVAKLIIAFLCRPNLTCEQIQPFLVLTEPYVHKDDISLKEYEQLKNKLKEIQDGK